jgi:anti-sigma-K factor RskA
MRETARTRRGSTALPTSALLTGSTLFVIGVALGLAAAVRFSTALRRSAASCAQATGNGMAWWAVVASIAAVAVAALALVAELRWRPATTRPVTVVLAAAVVGASMFGAALNLFVVHEIASCAALFG